MTVEPKVLVSWYTDPRYIAPFSLSPAQVTVGPKAFPDQPMAPYRAWTPIHQPYDLHHVVRKAGINEDFDVVVVFSDSSNANTPFNLEAFQARTVLCIGDTHHLEAPLRRTISYAQSARYDHVALLYARQHLHWFARAGFANLAWLPGLRATDPIRLFNDSTREPVITFMGSFGDYHPRRRRLIEHMQSQGLPVYLGAGPRDFCSERYAASQICFNCSLNGDLNLRIFEVLGAGGCLLTDRLSPSSGLDLLLPEGKAYVAYQTDEELVREAFRLLKSPADALSIASIGANHYSRGLTPEHRTRDLLRWIEDGDLDPRFKPEFVPKTEDPTELASRMALFETIQEEHRTQESVRVLIDKDCLPAYRQDLADLPRVQTDEIDVSRPPPRRLTSSGSIYVRCDFLVIVKERQPPRWVRAANIVQARGKANTA